MENATATLSCPPYGERYCSFELTSCATVQEFLDIVRFDASVACRFLSDEDLDILFYTVKVRPPYGEPLLQL